MDFDKNNNENEQSLTKKYLPCEVWDWLSIQTSYGTTIYDCCKSGLECPESKIGLYAPDPEVYDKFSKLFYPLISEYHKVDVKDLIFVHDFGNPSELVDWPILFQDQIISTRVRVGRTVKGFPMASKLTRENRLELELRIKEALSKLDGDLAGSYRSLTEMSYDERNVLIEQHLMYDYANDKFLRAAGGYNDWPIGRGIFINQSKNFIVWVNEEDHIRIISMQKGASLKQVWHRLVRGIRIIEAELEFERHEKFGFLTFCPTNIGTGLRASVHVKLPKLDNDKEKLNEICESMDLQPRGVYGEHTESFNGIYDISNKLRLGRTESNLINDMMFLYFSIIHYLI